MTETLAQEDNTSAIPSSSTTKSAAPPSTARSSDSVPRSRLPRLLVILVSIATFMYLSMFGGTNGIIQQSKKHMMSVENRTAVDKTILFQIRQQNTRAIASTIARVYAEVPSSTWCIDGAQRYDQAKRQPMGLCYVKLPKAASSTLAGVNKRVARNVAKRQGLSRSCIRHDGHTFGMYYYKRHKLSFLWTAIRDPARRALSRVAFGFSGNSGDEYPSQLDDPKQVIQALKSTDEQFGAVSSGRGGFQLQYTMLTIIDEWSAWNSTDPAKILDPPLIKKHVQQVIDGYNFVGIIERMDESLVALQLLLGLEVSDILYMSSKVHGTYDRRPIVGGGGRKFECVKLASFNATRAPGEVLDYLTSPEWFAKNYGDYLLYHAANISLDRTILDIGLPRFAKALKEYRSLQRLANNHCHSRVHFPCSPNGTDQIELSKSSCISEDEACGYKCMYCTRFPLYFCVFLLDLYPFRMALCKIIVSKIGFSLFCSLKFAGLDELAD